MEELLKSRLSENAFTLIELMIVVAIIGILVSVAVPNFKQHANKARQGEAKLALGAIFALEKSFYAEYSAYAPAFDSIGYSPEGRRRFYTLSTCDPAGGGTSMTITGFSGAISVYRFYNVNVPFAPTWTGTCSSGFVPNCTAVGNDPQSYLISAMGQLNATGTMDIWTITDTKNLVNCNPSL